MEPVRRTRSAPKPAAIEAASRLTISSKYMGKDESTPKNIEVRKFEVEPAYVRVSAGMTKNMGNYESLRVDVALTVPCYTEEIDKVVPLVADKVAAFLQDELSNYEE